MRNNIQSGISIGRLEPNEAALYRKARLQFMFLTFFLVSLGEELG